MEGGISLEDIFLSYYDCRCNKRNSQSSLLFEFNYEINLINLWKDVNNRTYKPNPSIVFIVTKPRPREIFAADFRDRVLHHLVDLKIRPLIEGLLIDETCNNRIGKGTGAAVNYVHSFLKTADDDDWICKIDMKNFFMSISKSLLTKKIVNLVKDKYVGGDKNTLI